MKKSEKKVLFYISIAILALIIISTIYFFSQKQILLSPEKPRNTVSKGFLLGSLNPIISDFTPAINPVFCYNPAPAEFSSGEPTLNQVTNPSPTTQPCKKCTEITILCTEQSNSHMSFHSKECTIKMSKDNAKALGLECDKKYPLKYLKDINIKEKDENKIATQCLLKHELTHTDQCNDGSLENTLLCESEKEAFETQYQCFSDAYNDICSNPLNPPLPFRLCVNLKKHRDTAKALKEFTDCICKKSKLNNNQISPEICADCLQAIKRDLKDTGLTFKQLCEDYCKDKCGDKPACSKEWLPPIN